MRDDEGMKMGEDALSPKNPQDEAYLEEVWATQRKGQSVRLTRETAHECWVGRKDKLLRIEQYLADSLKAVFLEEMSNFPEDAPPRMREVMAKRLQLRVVVTSGKGKIRRTGDLASVLGEMDLGEVESIEMSNRSSTPIGLREGSPAVKLTLGHDADDFVPRILRGPRAVRWKVSGDDRQWVGGTFDWVATEIAKDVPWWAFIRTRAASVFIGILIATGVGGLLLASGASTDSDRAQIYSAIPLVMMYGALIGPFALRPILNRLFPALELIEPGATSRGRQVLAVAVGLVSFGLSVTGVVLGVLAL